MRGKTYMSEDGRIVLPAAIRRAADVRPKEVLTVRVDEEGIHIQTRREAIRQAQAVVREFTKGRPGLVQEFLSERRTIRSPDSSDGEKSANSSGRVVAEATFRQSET